MTDHLQTAIEALEKAAEGSTELDAHICGLINECLNFRVSGRLVIFTHPGGGNTSITAPYYTTSIDAALTLVPEGWAVDGLTSWPCGTHSNATLLPCHREGNEWWHGSKDGPPIRAPGNTLALALCIAALKARTLKGDDNG